MNWILTGLISWKTTITGVLTGVFLMLDTFGVIIISAEEKQQVIAAAIIIISWFAKDGDKTGTPKTKV